MKSADGSSILPYLPDSEVRALLSLTELIGAVEEALVAFSAGKAAQPLRSVVSLDEGSAHMFAMPARHIVAGLKLVTLAPRNAAIGLPTHSSVVLAVHPKTGIPMAVMDADYITQMRTAAASVVATKYLADASPRKLALIGAGVQAEGHLVMMRQIFPRIEASVWARDGDKTARFAEVNGCKAAPTAEEAVADADVVVTATTSTTPVLKGAWLKPGAHVNAVGAPRPDWRELDDAAMANVVFADSRAAALTESGDVIGAQAEIAGEIGDVAAGRLEVDRSRTTIFKSLGQAVEDMAAAYLVLREAGLVSALRGQKREAVPQF